MRSFDLATIYPFVSRRLVRGAAAACLLFLGQLTLPGQTLPSGFAESLVVGGLPSNLTAMAFAPDGRLFICRQSGELLVIKNGALLPRPFLTVTVDSTGERGLGGIIFDPNFQMNGYVYVYYTATTPNIHNRVSRFTANPTDPDVSQAGSEFVVTDIDPLLSPIYHNGGGMGFGPDGKLYISVGDNTSAPNAQNMSTRKGKVLRINPDGSIPQDNPFYMTASGENRAIWALGFRNPFTLAFQPGDGALYVNDVGANSWEEINGVTRGANYGWPSCEGACPQPNPNFVDPVFAYPHGSGELSGCSITGGVFYSPAVTQFPAEYVGKYFFMDFCNRWIRVLNPVDKTVSGFMTNTSLYSLAIALGPDGCLYYLSRGASGYSTVDGVGGVYKIRYTGVRSPQIGQHPVSQTISEGKPVTFVVRVSGDTPLGYQWQRNGVNISGATSSKYTIAATKLSDDGAQFRCVVRNSLGTQTSNAATLTVVPNQAPSCTIDTPPEGTLYSGGDTINYSGTASDSEDGLLAGASFTWQVDFHHADHMHPFIAPVSGATSGSFTIPTTGETADDVWYRIRLTVRDSAGATTSTFRDVLPRKVTLTLDTIPAALQLTLDGTPVTAPYSTTAVAGMSRTLGVVSPQTAGGTTYVFDSWSDGGAATHDILTPQVSATYTARFVASSTPTPTPTPSPVPANNATFESQAVPATMVPGQTYNVAVTMRNTGTTTWSFNDRHKLGSENPRDNVTWAFNRVRLPSSTTVDPGVAYTFNFSVTAPSQPGSYNFQWRMLQEATNGGWFGPKTPNIVVTVANATTPARHATFQTQSVPTTMTAGQPYNVSVTMKNTGTTAWTFAAADKLGSQNSRDNTVWGLNRVRLPFNGSVPAGATWTFNFTVTAPSTPGRYNFQWQMLREAAGGGWFGDYTPNVAINVQ